MKQIAKLVITIIMVATMARPSLAVPVGNDVEYIPPARNLGVGVIDPSAKLEVNGQVMITGGNPQAGYVLTSDAFGLATWTEVSVLGSNVNGTVALADSVIKLVAPDGSPDPAFSVDNDGNLVSAGGNISVPADVEIGINRPSTSPRSITWDTMGTLIRDTGHIDFFADDNNDNSGVGFKFFVNSADRSTAKLVAQISDQGTVAATKFVGDGSMLTGISVANVANADTANTADYAPNAGTATTVTDAITATNMNNGTILDTQILGGVINGSTLTKISFDNLDTNSPSSPWELVHVETFDTTAEGWSKNTVTACGPHNILGGYNVTGKGSNLIKTLNLANVPHTHVYVKFNYYSIDSFDSEYGIFKIDNEIAWSEKFEHYSTDAAYDRKHICGNPSTAGFSDKVVAAKAIKEHTTDTLKLQFSATLDEIASNESFGIDNLEVWVRKPYPQMPKLDNWTGVSSPKVTCSTLRMQGNTTDGIYTVDVDGNGPKPAFQAYCDMTTEGGGWMLVKRLVPRAVADSANWANRIRTTAAQGTIGASDVLGTDEYTVERSNWPGFDRYLVRRYTTANGKSNSLTFNSSGFEFSNTGVYSGSGSAWIQLQGAKLNGTDTVLKYANVPSGGHIQSGSCQLDYATIGHPVIPTGEIAFCNTLSSSPVVYNSVNSFWGSPFATNAGTSTADPRRMTIFPGTTNTSAWDPSLGMLVYVRDSSGLNPAYSNWVQANKQDCAVACSNIGKTNTPDPNGFKCTAGEARSQTSVEAFNNGVFDFTYGCWSDGNCQNYSSNSSSMSYGKYCYKPGQVRDNDSTDKTVACYCT